MATVVSGARTRLCSKGSHTPSVIISPDGALSDAMRFQVKCAVCGERITYPVSCSGSHPSVVRDWLHQQIDDVWPWMAVDG